MALITERAGRVYIRVGGNSQETASLVDSLPGGVAMSKDKTDSSNPVSLVSILNHSITHTVLYSLTDRNTDLDIHTRDYLHACQRLIARQRQVVLRYALQIPYWSLCLR